MTANLSLTRREVMIGTCGLSFAFVAPAAIAERVKN